MAEIIKNIIEPNIGKNKAQEMLEKLERKMKIEEIHEITGLSEEEIKQLAEN